MNKTRPQKLAKRWSNQELLLEDVQATLYKTAEALRQLGSDERADDIYLMGHHIGFMRRWSMRGQAVEGVKRFRARTVARK